LNSLTDHPARRIEPSLGLPAQMHANPAMEFGWRVQVKDGAGAGGSTDAGSASERNGFGTLLTDALCVGISSVGICVARQGEI
jgi:hypothetical protein